MGSEVGTEFRSGNATTEWLTECVPRCIRGMSSRRRYFPPTLPSFPPSRRSNGGAAVILSGAGAAGNDKAGGEPLHLHAWRVRRAALPSRAKETLPLPGLWPWPGLAPPSDNPVPSALDPRRPAGRRGPRQLSPWRDKIHPPSLCGPAAAPPPPPPPSIHPSLHPSPSLPPSDIPSSSPIL